MTGNVSRNGLITALDIGTSKIACLIARLEGKGSAKIIGSSVCRSAGYKSGKVTNIQALEKWVRKALALAEDKTENKVSTVLINLSSASIVSSLIEAQVQLSKAPVTETDVDKVLSIAFDKLEDKDSCTLHRIPFSYSIDEEQDKEDPRGMTGSMLGARINIISANVSPIRDLNTVAENSMVDIGRIVASPYASGLAVIKEEEKEIGCTVIDLGAGSTSIAVFESGRVKYVACIPIGCRYITADIAHFFSISMENAEELKTLEGSTFCSPFNEKDSLAALFPADYAATDDESCYPLRKNLVAAIEPRVVEIFELAKKKLEMDGFLKVPSRRLILTGGGSQLQGIRECAAKVFSGKQIRIGTPYLQGLPKDMESPAFATVTGILKYALTTVDYGKSQRKEDIKKTKRFGRIGEWFLQSF